MSWPCEAETPRLSWLLAASALRVEFLLFILLHWNEGALTVRAWGERCKLL